MNISVVFTAVATFNGVLIERSHTCSIPRCHYFMRKITTPSTNSTARHFHILFHVLEIVRVAILTLEVTWRCNTEIKLDFVNVCVSTRVASNLNSVYCLSTSL